MSRMPRLLPLVAIAAVGVLAINLVENGPGIIGAARSFAEDVGGKAPAKADKALPDDASIATGAADGQAVAAKPAPVCAPTAVDLAKEAGLSPAELQVLQSLGDRRGALDEREQGLDTQVELIAAAEAKVDAKIATMNQLKADMATMLGQLDDKQQAEVDRLVKVFESMKDTDAAARFVLLTDEVRLPIAGKMKPKILAAMLAKMPPPEAKRLTESLAARYVAQADAARAALNPPAAPPAATPAATPPAPAPKPVQQVAAATPPAAPNAGAPAAPAKPVHRKPHTVHHPAATSALAGATPPAGPSAGAAAGGKPLASAQPAAPPPVAPKTSTPAPKASGPASGASAPAATPPAKSG